MRNMSLDGKLLARARERLAEVRAENEREQTRRQERAWAAVPELKDIDARQRELFAGVLEATMGGGSEGALQTLDEQSLALRARKAELLAKAGFPADYLEDIVSCKQCRDTGLAPDGRPCLCLMRLYKAEQAKELSSLMRLQKDDFRDFDLRYYSTEPDPGKGISPRENMSLVLESCRSYAELFQEGTKNLLFRGGTGLGKTFLSACIAKVVAAQGFSVVYDTAVAVFEAFELSKFSRETPEGAAGAEKTRRILSCDLMILDDLGTEMTTVFTQSALYTVINTRLNEGKKTIISTNLSEEELAARYTAQIVSRIQGEYETLPFLGRDVREIKKERRYL